MMIYCTYSFINGYICESASFVFLISKRYQDLGDFMGGAVNGGTQIHSSGS